MVIFPSGRIHGDGRVSSLLLSPFILVDSELMAPIPAAQQQPQRTGNKTAILSSIPSPTATADQTASHQPIIPDALRQLPEAIRQVLHGCVTGISLPAGGGASERGAHLTVYITSADPAGI